jgi:hypothetical protein
MMGDMFGCANRFAGNWRPSRSPPVSDPSLQRLFYERRSLIRPEQLAPRPLDGGRQTADSTDCTGRRSAIRRTLSMADDTKLTITSYTLNLGFRSVSIDEVRDIVPYHEIGLTAVADAASPPIRITIELWADVRHFAPTELGFYDTARNTIRIKVPMSEFDRTSDLLRYEEPLFFVFNQLDVAGSPTPKIKRISSASIVSEDESAGEGE